MRTLKELAQEAITIQNACNPLGLTKGYAEAIQDLARNLRKEGKDSTDNIAMHPINKLWASKMHELARMGLSDLDRYGEAYEACKKLAE